MYGSGRPYYFLKQTDRLPFSITLFAYLRFSIATKKEPIYSVMGKWLMQVGLVELNYYQLSLFTLGKRLKKKTEEESEQECVVIIDLL